MSETFRLIHLSGGLRCCLKPEIPRLDVWPFANKADVQITLKEAKSFINILQSRDLALIGIEEGVSTSQGRFTALWQVFPHVVGEIDPEKMPVSFWAGVKAASSKKGHRRLKEICSSVAFSLTAMERHLLALSNEYERELHAALERGTKPKHRFSSIETYDLWLAIHAFLLAGGSARDYLAQALVNFVFDSDITSKERRRLDSMSGLLNHDIKGGYLHRYPIGKTLLAITDKNDPSAWLANMSEYRNVITHRAPITGFSDGDSLQLYHTGAFGEHDVLQVGFPLPDKPRSLRSSAVVDALKLMRFYNERMADLALEVGKLMPYGPETITLTEKDIIDIERL
jgi:hypothetical protein